MGAINDIINGTEDGNSLLEQSIRKLEIPICQVFLKDGQIAPVGFKTESEQITTKDTAAVNAVFPKTTDLSQNRMVTAVDTGAPAVSGKRVAVLFSGGPAPGGHNVVCGLFNMLGDTNTLLGVKAGPKGLLQGDLFEITKAEVDRILNTGGFDFLGSDRTKIKTDVQFAQVRSTCQKHKLDAIVVIGGDDSNTNAAVLAEFLAGDGVQVIGVPKTIDGDLQIGEYLPISFGFDTATKIYAELVGNILQDTPSSRKYWHFVKLMGRSASHVALEVALQTKPAMTLISEEIAEKHMSLAQIVDVIAQTIVTRSRKGINHGVVLIPEGIIEFIPEMNTLIAELNDKVAEFGEILKAKPADEKRDFIYAKITAEHAQLMASLPDYIEDMLLAERDSHGNLQVSLIPTERLLIEMVRRRIEEIDSKVPFKTHSHFFGYEGRCGAPTLFDAAYTFNLGLTAGALILNGKTGFIAGISQMDKGGKPLALPLTGLLNIERRHGHDEMVIEKALVTMDSPAFKYFEQRREVWAQEDHFSSPGPRQFWGSSANQIPYSVALNRHYSAITFTL